MSDTLGGDDDTRRSFLGRTALVGGALVALGGGSVAVTAQTDDDTADDESPAAAFDDVGGTDVDVLNYALSLEQLEDAFYQDALDRFEVADFVEAEPLADFDESFRRAMFDYVGVVAEHESTHVDVLTQAVELLGGDPPAAGTYDFGVETVADFLDLGQTLENTGVAAYAGAAPFVESPDLLGTALSIHSVEARHAAVLNLANGASPFPDAFDSAATQEAVLEAIGPLVVTDSGSNGNGNGNGNMTATPTTTDDNTTETGNSS